MFLKIKISVNYFLKLFQKTLTLILDENNVLCHGSFCSLIDTIKTALSRFPRKADVNMELTVNITGDGVKLFEDGYFALVFGVKLPELTGSKIYPLVIMNITGSKESYEVLSKNYFWEN